jgi:peptide/nickel transport system substrate-binding protein
MRSILSTTAGGLCVLGLALAGCGGSDGGGSGADARPLASAAPSATTHADVTEPVRVAIPAKVTTLDPDIASNFTDARILHLVGGNLYVFTPDGRDVEPAIAESGRFGPGDRSFTVTLTAGARFSDGDPLTAEDVVATFQRAKADRANVYAGQLVPLAAVRAEGADAVRFTFTRPYPSWTTFLAYPNMAILKKSEIGARGEIPAVPTFAGAYVPDQRIKGNTFALARNADYPGPAPAAERLDMTVVADPNSRVQQTRGGQVDVAFDPPPSQLRSLTGSVLRQVQPGFGFVYLNMDNGGEILRDVRVRKAISLALDRTRISSVGFAGQAPPLSGFFPTSMEGHVEAAKPDPAAARALLRGTACESGCELSILLNSGYADWAPNVAVVVQNSLAPIGIKTSIASTDDATFSEKQPDQIDMALALFADYSNVPEGLPAYCLDAKAGFASCASGYDSRAATAAVEALSVAGDAQARTAATDEINRLFADDAPYATLTDTIYALAVSKDVAGLVSFSPTALFDVARLEQ